MVTSRFFSRGVGVDRAWGCRREESSRCCSAATTSRNKSVGQELCPRPYNNRTVMGPKRDTTAGREILLTEEKKNKKKQNKQLDSSNSPLAHGRGENLSAGEELPCQGNAVHKMLAALS